MPVSGTFRTIRMAFLAVPLVTVTAFLALGCGSRTQQLSETAELPIGPGPTWNDLVERADNAIALGNQRRALTYLERALHLRPESAEVLFRAAELHVDFGDLDKGREFLVRGLWLKENTAARNLLGYLQARDGLFDLAAEQFERVLAAEPEDPYALAHLGVAYQELGRSREAIRMLEPVSAYDLDGGDEGPDYVARYLGLAYLDTRQYGKALAAFAATEELTPEDAAIARQIGRVHELRDDPEAALEAYERAYLLDPTDAETRHRVEALARLIREREAAASEAPIPAWDGRPVSLLPDDLQERIDNAPSAEDFPDTDAVVLLNRVEHECLPDGRSRVTRHRLIVLLRQGTTWDGDDLGIPFNAAAQSLTVHVARAIPPDGRVLDLRAASICEASPPVPLGSGLAADARWTLPAMPGLPEDTVIEYQVTTSDAAARDPAHEDWLSGGMAFQSGYPTLESQYGLRVPAEIAGSIRWDVADPDAEALAQHEDRSVEDGTITHVWEYGRTGPVDGGSEAARFAFSLAPLRATVDE